MDQEKQASKTEGKKKLKNETLRVLHSLRTIHGDFSERNVEEQDVVAILDACLQAANASARQSYSIIQIRNRERMRKLLSYEGSVALVYCVDFTRLRKAAEYVGSRFDADDIVDFLTAAVDASLAAQTAVIAARSLGIDSMITNGLHRNSLDLVYRELNLPERSCFPLITVVFGYAKQEPMFSKGRLPGEYLVHHEQHALPDEEQLGGMVMEYDDRKKHIGMIDNWVKQGFEHYLNWFFETWSSKPGPEKIREMQDRLVKSGFWQQDR